MTPPMKQFWNSPNVKILVNLLYSADFNYRYFKSTYFISTFFIFLTTSYLLLIRKLRFYEKKIGQIYTQHAPLHQDPYVKEAPHPL